MIKPEILKKELVLRSLGQTGIMITPVGLGCWQFSRQNNLVGKFWPVMEGDMINKVVDLSLQGGINWFDTAEAYGAGASEKALSEALVYAGRNPGDVVIATKWWPMFRTAGNIRINIKERVAALSPFPVDLYQVHQPYGFSSEKKEMEAMAEVFADGKIRAVGVSNFNTRQMINAWETLKKKGIPLASNQMRYSLLDRKIESKGIMKAARELGISIIAYSPLAQGILTGKFHEKPELIKNTGIRRYTPGFSKAGLKKSMPVINLLREIAIKYQVSPAQVALNWLIHFHGETVVVIPGATKESHVKENTGAMGFRLSDEEMDRLDRVSSIYK